MKSKYKIFNIQWIKIMVAFIFIQQLLVAGGTYFLGEIVRQFPEEGLRWNTAVCLFFCIFLPGTFIHYWVVSFTTRAYKETQRNYLNEYIQSNYSQPTHWRNEDSKQKRHDIMSRGGQETIGS